MYMWSIKYNIILVFYFSRGTTNGTIREFRNSAERNSQNLWTAMSHAINRGNTTLELPPSPDGPRRARIGRYPRRILTRADPPRRPRERAASTVCPFRKKKTCIRSPIIWHHSTGSRCILYLVISRGTKCTGSLTNTTDTATCRLRTTIKELLSGWRVQDIQC